MYYLNMHLARITDTAQFNQLQEQWNQLLLSGDSYPLPLTHEWVSAWWKEFANNRSLCIFCVYDGSTLIAIAPFYKEKSHYRGIPVQQLHLLTDGHSPYSDVIYNAALSSSQVNQVLRLIIQQSDSDLLIFSKLPETSPTFKSLMRSNEAHQYNIVTKQNLKTPSIKISGDWDTFFKQRTRKFRKSINNKLNRFKKQPDFNIECVNVSSVTHPVLNEIIEISKRSWKASIKSDLGSDIAGRQFLLDLVEIFGKKNCVNIWILRNKNLPVAYEFHITFDKIVYPIRADYADDFKKHSPGSILEYTVLKHLFDEHVIAEYYTCADNYWYLNNWSNNHREHYTVEVFKSNIKAHSLHFLEKHLIPIARYIKNKLPLKKASNNITHTKLDYINNDNN